MVALALCMVLGQAADAPYQVSDRPVQFMSRRELKVELAKLEDARPGIGGPIAMVSVGAGLFVYSLISLVGVASSFGGLGGAFRSANPIGYVYVTMMVAGAGLLLPGIWLWWTRREDRQVMGDRMDEITAQLDKLDREREQRRESATQPQRERPAQGPVDYPL
jgi:hypothetical protein